MAIFSNLSGTMQTIFSIGKNGIRLLSNSSSLSIQDDNSNLAQVSAGEPIANSHLVTKNFLLNNSTFTYYGGTIPDPTLGVNGNLYIQISDTNIIKIYFKHNDIWKTTE